MTQTQGADMQKNTLWSGGRLEAALNQSMADLNRSLDIDKRMAEQDIRGSQAWAKGICKCGILTDAEYEQIRGGLDQVWEEIKAGSFVYQDTDEDIHTAVERRLTELIGPAGGKLHTGRSRNDQVVTDFRLWMMDTIPELDAQLRDLQKAFIERARRDMDVYVSGYTHFQQAQPILLSHWWMSHFWALDRDRQRLMECGQHADSLPLGCGALAGTAYPVDRFDLSQDLGFSIPAPNSLDAVSDRDFACDFLYWAAMLGMHLSRCAEAMILYSTMEYGYLTLSDAFSTGSSLMPQKKNPDSLELIRGKSGMQSGLLFSLLSSLKGLPSAYDKDLQEDKQLVFKAADTAALTMAVMKGVIDTLTVNKERCMKVINTQALATDLADYLVKRGMPFREAHHAVGKAVKLSETMNCDLKEIPMEKWKEISLLFAEDVYEVFSVENAVDARCAWGGTARSRVEEQIRFAERVLENS
ncbi:MAG: argininosuccinate lyase [Flexilinea sp.]|nr:argininosuccinate lyase [Flexilinea sp.]